MEGRQPGAQRAVLAFPGQPVGRMNFVVVMRMGMYTYGENSPPSSGGKLWT